VSSQRAVAMATELIVSILEVEGDAAMLERASIQLSQELGELDVDSVAGLPGGQAPDGSRSGSVAALGSLLVSLQPSTAVLASLVKTVRGWLTRGGTNRTVRLEVGGNVLELTGTTSALQERLVDEWIKTHSQGHDGKLP
jgi:hypothetical protein